MLLELFHKALFAFISGFSELIFTSASAHQLLYRTVTGYDLDDHFLSFGIHLGCLIALLIHCQKRIKHLRNEKRLENLSGRRRGRKADVAALMDVRILNTAVIPVLIGFCFYRKTATWGSNPFWLALLLIGNGVVLFLPRLLRSGNKNGRSFTQMDGLLVGLSGMLGMLPGFGRTGCMFSACLARGGGKNYALDLSLLLSIPAVAAMLGFDLYGCFVTAGGATGLQLLGCVVAGLAAYAGIHFSIILIRSICSRSTTEGFAYYSWGLAMFLLLIYLFVS